MLRLPRNEKQTYRLNSRAQMWPSGLTLAVTLTWIFKVKYRICYISAKNGPIARKPKANISIEPKASNVTIRFDLGHELDLEFSRSNMEFPISQPKKIATKQKANISIELQASNVTNVFDLDHNLDLWILKVKRDLHLWPHRWPWPWIFMVKFWRADWHCTKGVAVGHSWPWSWPFGDQGQVYGSTS